MTPILVLATFVVFIVARWYLEYRRQKQAEVAQARGPIQIPDAADPSERLAGFLFHPGHTWIHVHEDGLVSVGATSFAANFAGHLSQVVLPREGSRLRLGDEAWTLVSVKDRRLSQTMPVEGKVVAVNRELLDRPDLTQRSAYEKGWILRIRPKRLEESLRNLLPRTSAQGWIDATLEHFNAVLSPAMGRVAFDGGEWVRGFGDQLEGGVWESLRHELFPTT